MIVDRIDTYVRNVLCSGELELTPEVLIRHEALQGEVEKLAGYIFRRQFLQPEESAEKGRIRLSSCGRCPRQQAYKYHGFPQAGKEIDKRAKVVFFMGDLTELLLIALARLAGCEISDYGLTQVEVSLSIAGTIVVGHPDGFITQDNRKHLLEVKSMPSYAYERFERGEIDDSYRAQINAYLEASGLDTCCLVALNKDSGVTTEQIVRKDPYIVAALKNNLAQVLMSKPENLPARAYEPDAKNMLGWQCRYCGWWRTCWPTAEEVLVKNSYKLTVK